jgi:Domain of unknown function (DUF4258)
MKKAIPYLLLAVLFVIAFFVKQYRESSYNDREQSPPAETGKSNKSSTDTRNNLDVFRDPDAEYFFTRHARCRMECRRITQKEVKEIVRKADVNYNKSNLNDLKGPTYALEGYTSKDKQHVRIIVAPKQKHLSIVTVIDLDKDWECPSCN